MATNVIGTCATCSQPLTGRFCAHCGEEAHDAKTLTVAHFLSHTLAHEVLHLDGKIWRTLRFLVGRPGFLAAEYCAGRRRAYVNPVRIFLSSAIVYALLTQGGLNASLFIGRITLSVAPTAVPKGASVERTVARIDRYGILARLVERKKQTTDLESETVRERFHSKLDRFAEPLSFANVFLLAVALHALFHRRRALLVENGVFSMHVVSFVLLSSLLFVPVMPLLRLGYETTVFVLLASVLIWQFAYLAVGIRRFYFGGDPGGAGPAAKAALAALVVYLVNSVFITAAQLAGGALALWTL